jgi:hypothetical protein
MSPRAFRRLASWIATLALLAVTLMPTFARVLDAGGDGVDICSVAAPGAPAHGDPEHALDHCPYCALQAHLAAPPAPATAAVPAPVRWRPLPAAFLRAPRASAVWVASQARAPPVRA